MECRSPVYMSISLVTLLTANLLACQPGGCHRRSEELFITVVAQYLEFSIACVTAGSSRTVSRRYIADFVSKKNRMRASTGMHLPPHL